MRLGGYLIFILGIVAAPSAHAQEHHAVGYGFFSCMIEGEGLNRYFLTSSPSTSEYRYGPEGVMPDETDTSDGDPTSEEFWDFASEQALKKAYALQARMETFLPAFESEWQARFLNAVARKYGAPARAQCSSGLNTSGPYESADDSDSSRRIVVVGEMSAAVDAIYEAKGQFDFIFTADELDMN